MEPLGQKAQAVQAFRITFRAQVLEQAECSSAGAIYVAVDALYVIFVALSYRIDKRIVRTAHRALALAYRPIVFRQCPEGDTQNGRCENRVAQELCVARKLPLSGKVPAGSAGVDRQRGVASIVSSQPEATS